MIHATDNKVLLRKECGAGHRWLRRHSLPSRLQDSGGTNVTQMLTRPREEVLEKHADLGESIKEAGHGNGGGFVKETVFGLVLGRYLGMEVWKARVRYLTRRFRRVREAFRGLLD